MHLKTHFSFLFNSSKISISCAHVIFFLNTRLHCESKKFESHHLDLHIWSYKIHNTAFKTGNLNYPFEQIVTDAWGPRVSRTRLSVRRKQGRHTRWRGNGEARRRRLLRRNRRHRRAPHNDAHQFMPSLQPLPNPSKDDGVHGGRRRSPTVLRRGSALWGTAKLDMSFRRSPRYYPNK